MIAMNLIALTIQPRVMAGVLLFFCIFFLVALPWIATGQTKIPVAQVQTAGAAGRAFVVNADGQGMFAVLGDGIVLESSGSTAVLRAVLPTEKQLAFVATPAQSGTSLVLPSVPSRPSSIKLHRNGVLQTLGIDYSISVDRITLVPEQATQPGDVINIAWY